MSTSLRTIELRRAGASALSDISTSGYRMRILGAIEVHLQAVYGYLDISDNFPFRHDAEDAIDGLDGRKYDGRELSVQYAR